MLSGFPSLQQAFTIILNVTTISPVGTVASGSDLTQYTANKGTIISVPGFVPAINADVTFGADHLYTDPDGNKLRVNVNCIAKTDDDINISFGYHGTYFLDDAMKQILAGAPFEGKLPFGPATAYLTFEIGNEKYKFLEDTTFVGDARILVEGGNLAVESRWSAVVSSTDSD